MDKLLIVTSYSLIKIFQPDRLQDWKNKQKYKEHMHHLKMETWHWKPYLDIPSPYLISHSYPHAQPGAGPGDTTAPNAHPAPDRGFTALGAGETDAKPQRNE